MSTETLSTITAILTIYGIIDGAIVAIVRLAVNKQHQNRVAIIAVSFATAVMIVITAIAFPFPSMASGSSAKPTPTGQGIILSTPSRIPSPGVSPTATLAATATAAPSPITTQLPTLPPPPPPTVTPVPPPPTVTPIPPPTLTPIPPPAPTPSPSVYDETAGPTSGSGIFTNYANAGGLQSQRIAPLKTIQVRCALTGFKTADGNPWWYRLAFALYDNGGYYAPADNFYNNGQTSGDFSNTPWLDAKVPLC